MMGNQIRRVGLPTGLLVTFCLASGCLEKPKGGGDLGTLVPASGIVKVKGQPAKDIFVTFYPQGGTGAPAHGKTTENGRFIMTTAKKNDGAVIGAHVVTVQPMMEGTLPGKEREGPGASKIPIKYESPSTSPLSFTVENGKANDFTIEIND